MYGNENVDITGSGDITVLGSCLATMVDSDTNADTDTDTAADTDTGSALNVQLFSNPFYPASGGELFLDQSSVCIDAGDAATGELIYPGGWADLTTAADMSIEGVTNVDAGIHYSPDTAHVIVFDLQNGEDLTWNIYLPDSSWSCVIKYINISQTPVDYIIPESDLPVGSTTFQADTDALMPYVICSSPSGGYISNYGLVLNRQS
jgi:hypothetical protein